MTADLPHCRSWHLAVMLALTGLMLVGCQSAPKIDWDSRIGSYTYDQAIAELGPPDKSAKLSDGSTVADWMKHRSGGVSFGLSTGYWGDTTGVGVGQRVSTGYQDRVLRLIFGPDNQLKSWSKNY